MNWAKFQIVDNKKEYSEEELMNVFKRMPDANRFPFPDAFMKKYDLVKPQIQSFPDVVKNINQTIYSSDFCEVREPMAGGIRTIPIREENETPQITVVPQSQEETKSSD